MAHSGVDARAFGLILSFGTLLGPPPAPGQVPTVLSKAPPATITAEQVLDWLPANTETLIVMQELFKVEELTFDKQGRRKTPPMDQAIFGPFMLYPLADRELSRKGEVMGKELLGETVVLAVEGARGFRGPHGFGPVIYDGCRVLVFQRDLGAAGVSLVSGLKGEGAKSIEVAGNKVLVLERTLERDDWTFLVAQPKSNVLLVATQRHYLEEVLKRMQKKGQKRALPPELPEWRQVDVKAQLWAVRHFDKLNAANDFTSPLEHHGSVVPSNWDCQAIGFTLSYDPRQDKLARIRYLSTNPSLLELTETIWSNPEDENWKRDIRVKERAKGVVEVTVDPKHKRMTFYLMSLFSLGHGSVGP